MPRLTKRTVEAARPSAAGDVLLWDDELRGFGLRVKPSGIRSYVVQYRTRGGRSRRVTLGRHGPVTAEAARRRAQSMLGDVAKGEDPAAALEPARAGTVDSLAKRYLADHAEVRKKASSLRGDRYLLERHVKPRLGRLPLEAVTRQDVGALHHAMRETPYAANRALRLLSKMFALAERWGLRAEGTNPARGIDLYAETKRRRFLSDDELALIRHSCA
jgi:hypothetical protein